MKIKIVLIPTFKIADDNSFSVAERYDGKCGSDGNDPTPEAYFKYLFNSNIIKVISKDVNEFINKFIGTVKLNKGISKDKNITNLDKKLSKWLFLSQKWLKNRN
ncbi:MAG: hypothetical protein Q8936_06600 [Bacillota bacterium]|nr:hypothetical protein [Bacillota bacterium]